MSAHPNHDTAVLTGRSLTRVWRSPARRGHVAVIRRVAGNPSAGVARALRQDAGSAARRASSECGRRARRGIAVAEVAEQVVDDVREWGGGGVGV